MCFGHGFDSRLVHFMRPRSNTRRKFGEVDGTRVVIRTVIGDDDPVFVYYDFVSESIDKMLSERLIIDIAATELIKSVIKMIRSKTHTFELNFRDRDGQLFTPVFELAHTIGGRVIENTRFDRTHNIRETSQHHVFLFSIY